MGGPEPPIQGNKCQRFRLWTAASRTAMGISWVQSGSLAGIPQGRQAERIGGAGGARRQSLDMADRLAAFRAIEEKERAALGAVIAPHLGGAVLAGELRLAQHRAQIGLGQVEEVGGFAARR